MTVLSGAIDAKDTYTKGHSIRVAEYSKEIARRMGFTEKEQEDIYMIGLLHDVGKIGVPDAIINKSARLTDEEYNIIKQHPGMGAEIMINMIDDDSDYYSLFFDRIASDDSTMCYNLYFDNVL